MIYDYRGEMEQDIREAIENYEDWKGERITEHFEDETDAVNELYDILWIDDSVTGNGSGSYTFSTYDAEQNVLHNFDLLDQACEEFGTNIGDIYTSGGPEAWDVTIRCYLLGEVLHKVVYELFDTQQENE